MGPNLFPFLMLLVVIVTMSGCVLLRLALIRRKLRVMGFAIVRQDRSWRILPAAGHVAVGAFATAGSGDATETTIYVTEQSSYPYRLQVSTGVDEFVTGIIGGMTLTQRALSWTREHIAIPVFVYLCAYALMRSAPRSEDTILTTIQMAGMLGLVISPPIPQSSGNQESGLI